jgi:hypothetical protein
MDIIILVDIFLSNRELFRDEARNREDVFGVSFPVVVSSAEGLVAVGAADLSQDILWELGVIVCVVVVVVVVVWSVGAADCNIFVPIQKAAISRSERFGSLLMSCCIESIGCCFWLYR